MSNKKENLFIVKDLESVKKSKDIIGARIYYTKIDENKVSENRCKIGETIVFVETWSRGKFEKGEILGKFMESSEDGSKLVIIYKPNTWGVFAGLHNIVKDESIDKFYLNNNMFQQFEGRITMSGTPKEFKHVVKQQYVIFNPPYTEKKI